MTHPNPEPEGLFAALRNLRPHFPGLPDLWAPMCGLLMTAFLQIICIFGFPFLNRLIFDSILTTLDGTLLVQVTLAILLLVLAGTFFKVLGDFQVAHLRTKIVEALRRKSIRDVLGLEYLETVGKDRGDAVQKLIVEVDSIANGLTSLCRNFGYGFQLLLIVAILLAFDAALVGIFFGVAVLYVAMSLPLSRVEYALGMQSGRAMGGLYSMLYELFPAMKSVKCDNLYPSQLARFGGMMAPLPGLGMKNALLAAYAKLGYMLPNRLAHMGILVFGFWRLKSGDYTVGMFTMTFWFIDIVLEPLANLRGSLRTLLGASASASRLDELAAGRKETDGTIAFAGLSKGLELSGVAFALPSGKTLLHDISLRVPKGQKICIVGQSGAGKSTLVNLMAGLTHPTRGRILLDGVDMARYTRASLRDHVVLVSQDVFLFDDTVRRNVDLTGTLSDARILEACRIAELEAFIDGLPEGLSTRVGERGMLISGGERQRISLARALARGARFLVFDEATSALDPAMEARLLRNLRAAEEVRGPITLVAVAHRPAFVAGMESTYVLEAGRIVHSGAPAAFQPASARARLAELPGKVERGNGIG